MPNMLHYASPIGELLISEMDGALSGLWMHGQKYFPDPLLDCPREDTASPLLREAAGWLDRYFAGERPPVGGLPLAPQGSGFRQEVWKLLLEIPYGQTTTYGELSRKLAARMGLTHMSPQAVGGAVGHNPISIIIPCHRVLGWDGRLTGYAGGLERKRWLLEHEGLHIC